MELAIVRAAHLHVYLDVLREIGVSVERELARSRLPSWIEETPDAYISIPLALDWVAGCSRDIDLMELGFLAAGRASLACLSRPLRRSVIEAPTGFARLQAFLRMVGRDDNALVACMQEEGDQVRVICDMAGFDRNPFVCLAEWLNLQGMISVVRSVAGPSWCPPEMTFVSKRLPSDASLEAFANTRFLVGQPHTSILVDADALARPSLEIGAVAATRSGPEAAGPVSDDDGEGWSFIGALQSAVRPYLADGYPDLALVAEIVGTSKRTLQRRLQLSGQTYSGVVQQARFDLARELLHERSAKIIDVAMMSGYENPQHFSRAFRRMTGVTPSAYRRFVARTA